MGFERWYLRQHLAKRKWVTVGLLLVVLSVTMLSAGIASIYFQVSQKVADTTSMESTWVRVYSPQQLNQSSVSAIRGLKGVQEVIPAVLDTVRMSAAGRNSTQYVYFVTSGDAADLFRMFQLDQTGIASQSDWLCIGHNAAIVAGVPLGESTQVSVLGVGKMTATTAEMTFSDSDFYIFGDVQAYWVSPIQVLKSGQYNYLYIVADNSSAADALGKTLTEAHPNWSPYTPSQASADAATVVNDQLDLMLALTMISWVFGMVVFATYVTREVSSQSKELVTLGALGASRGELSRSLSYYLLILTSAGSLVGTGAMSGCTYAMVDDTDLRIPWLPVLLRDSLHHPRHAHARACFRHRNCGVPAMAAQSAGYDELPPV